MKEANQGPEAELEESKHGQELYQNGDETTAPLLLISSSAEYWRTTGEIGEPD